jgi:uncharacterized protein with GYD domain
MKGGINNMKNCLETDRQEILVNKLIELGIYKRTDGKQLYELSVEELEEEIKKIVYLVRNHYGIKTS